MPSFTGTSTKASGASFTSMPTRTTDTVPAPSQPGSSTDHLPKPVTAADRKSPKPTLSTEMKASIKAIREMDAPYLATDARWRETCAVNMRLNHVI